MFDRARRGVLFAGLLVALSLVWVGAAPAAGAKRPAPPAARLKPVAESRVGIKPYEMSSTSPYGGWRSGGSDQRNYALSPDGKLLATEDAGCWQLELWDVKTGKSLGRFGPINDPVAVDFSPDGKSLVSAGWCTHDACAVELWDVARRKRSRGLDEDVNWYPFTAAAFSADGKTLALGAGWGRRTNGAPAVHLWDVASGDEVRRLEGLAPAPGPKAWGSRSFDCLGFSPDGRCLAAVTNHRVVLCELATGKKRCLLGVLPPLHLPGGRGASEEPAGGVAFSPDGRVVAVGCPDGLVRLWDVVTGAELLPLAGHTGAVRAVRFLPDGRSLLSFGADNRALTWAVADARRDWPRPEDLSDSDLAALWDGLRAGDGFTRYAAVRTLAALPRRSLPLLRSRLKPVPPVDSARIARLVAGLHDQDFNKRKRAAIELRKLGDLALPALRNGNGRAGYDEVLQRFQMKLEVLYPTPKQRQALTALQILERMGTEEARRLLAELAKGASESLLTREARAALARWKEGAPAAGGGDGPEALWKELAGEDAGRAFRAFRVLAARPKEAVPLLRERLRPLAAREARDTPERIAHLVAQLDDDAFAVREEATRELSDLGKRAEPALRKALEAGPGSEKKKRLVALLEKANQPRLSADRLRADRALELLERIGTAPARQALEELAGGARNRWLKAAAADSLRRLGRLEPAGRPGQNKGGGRPG